MNNLGLILLAFMALVLVGCAQEELVPLEQASRASAYVDLKAQFCVDAPTPSFQKMRYLFITDHSSSNKPGFPDELTPEDVTNMDPEGRRRYGPLADFIRNLEEDPFQLNAYALVTFNSTARPRGGGFESDSDKFMQTVVNTWIGDGDATYPSPVDSGFTNYQAALEQARELIRNDAEIEAVVGDTSIKTVYNVILVTDGVPTVARNGGSYTQDFDIDLLPVIQAIMDVQDDPNYSKFISHITLNTAYYFGDTPSSEAISLLGKIADAGNGRYLQFGSGRNVLYQQFTPTHRLIKNQLVDVLVDNLNSRWWIDGTFRSDRDGDGLPDFVEIEMGSDPLKADSDGNGVSDFVEYKLRGVPCAGESCEAELAAPYAMCDGLDPEKNAQGETIFPYSSADRLNDCEKYLLGGNRHSFSSNTNFIPDFYAIKQGLPYMPGTEGSLSGDLFGDGLTNYEKAKLGLPLFVPKSHVPKNFRTRKTTLVNVTRPDEEEGVECYEVRVENIAVTSTEDEIEVMIIQNSAVIEDRALLKKASRSLSGYGEIKFTREDFK